MSKKILVVDDEKGIRELFAEVLRRAGHTVVTAPDGLAGHTRRFLDGRPG